MSKVRWGVLSTANIGTEKVIPGMQRSPLVEVIAIASRSQATAQAVAQRLGIPRAYGAYENLLADSAVEAVYIPLPNHLHVPWALKALAAGKHVLCEKPIALDAAEAATLADAAAQHPELQVMEAFMYRHHPQWQHARQLATDGSIGTLRAITTIFSYYLDDPSNIRNMAAIGGGALLDIGCYAISVARFLFAGEPQRVGGTLERDPRFGTDRLVSAVLEFAGGTATFTCATQLVRHQRVHIFGTSGRIEIEIPFNAPPDRPCRLWHEQGATTTEIQFDPCDQYTAQASVFSQAVRAHTPPPTPISDAVANMRVIDRVRASAAGGTWA